MVNKVNVLKDINGSFVTIKNEDLVNHLIESGFTVFGMDLSCIRTFLNEYEIRLGKFPVTVEEIKRVFRK